MGICVRAFPDPSWSDGHILPRFYQKSFVSTTQKLRVDMKNRNFKRYLLEVLMMVFKRRGSNAPGLNRGGIGFSYGPTYWYLQKQHVSCLVLTLSPSDVICVCPTTLRSVSSTETAS